MAPLDDRWSNHGAIKLEGHARAAAFLTEESALIS